MPAPKSSRQRFKPQLSCTLCRTRKLKCDRGHPCENCIKRDLASSCTFIHAGILRDRANHVQKPKATANTSDVHGRIKQLEELVVSFMQQQQQQQQDRNTNQPSLAHSPTTGSESKSETGRPSSLSDTQVWVDQTDLISTSGSLGRLAIDEDQQSYVGGAHWAAILDSISSLKESVNYEERPTQSDQEVERNPPLKTRGPQLLAGFVRKATRADMLASMPPKSIADILIAQMFDSGDISITGVHCGTFRKEYEQFWADPSQAPIMWIGLLYAIMCLATNLRILCGNDSPDIFSQVALRDQHEAITLFSEKTVQCLILGNYTEPCQYTIPTLLTYSLTEHFRSIDAQVGGWMLMGLIIRAAMRLGYHREPSYYPNISVYQGEVRRRIWLIITHLDLHVSCQVGLPRMLREDMYDTQIPRNLLDSDFDENTTVLPPSRDGDDLTICGSVTMKHKVTMALGRILDQANAITPMPYDEIMKLDAELHEGYQDVPERLRIRDLNALRHDRPELIVSRLGPDLMFHKGRCILHRKYLSPPSSLNSQVHPYSIKSCVDSAMAILSRHKYLWDETRPGKSLYHYKWKTTTLATQDFLLAAMLLCLYLTTFMDGETYAGEHAITFTRAEMLESLEISTQSASDFLANQ
ncbi:hypothetical protein B0O99DRAFT_512847 [Bisporella sp. PMI_857]|nr:hypothetical protein B0O99DRAFT_512847 [Bisporella sp. PMI_857]